MNTAAVSFVLFALIGSFPSALAAGPAKDLKVNINKSGVAKEEGHVVVNTFQAGTPEGFTAYHFALPEGEKFNCDPAFFNEKKLMVGDRQMTVSAVTGITVYWKNATPLLVHFKQPDQGNNHVYYKFKGDAVWEQLDEAGKGTVPFAGNDLKTLLEGIVNDLGGVPEGETPKGEIGGFTTLSLVSVSAAALSALYFL